MWCQAWALTAELRRSEESAENFWEAQKLSRDNIPQTGEWHSSTETSSQFQTLLPYIADLLPQSFTSVSCTPVSEHIVSHCYQIPSEMVSYHYITIFVRVFAPSVQHSASCWDTLRGAPLRQTHGIASSLKFVSVETQINVYIWISEQQKASRADAVFMLCLHVI